MGGIDQPREVGFGLVHVHDPRERRVHGDKGRLPTNQP